MATFRPALSQFRASESEDRRILCSSGTLCDGFWSSEVVKGAVEISSSKDNNREMGCHAIRAVVGQVGQTFDHVHASNTTLLSNATETMAFRIHTSQIVRDVLGMFNHSSSRLHFYLLKLFQAISNYFFLVFARKKYPINKFKVAEEINPPFCSTRSSISKLSPSVSN